MIKHNLRCALFFSTRNEFSNAREFLIQNDKAFNSKLLWPNGTQRDRSRNIQLEQRQNKKNIYSYLNILTLKSPSRYRLVICTKDIFRVIKNLIADMGGLFIIMKSKYLEIFMKTKLQKIYCTYSLSVYRRRILAFLQLPTRFLENLIFIYSQWSF